MKLIKDFLIKKTLFSKRLSLLENKKNFYEKNRSEKEILDYQITKFNEVWDYAVKNIVFYKKWQEKYKLPLKISSIKELSYFPPLTKEDIQKNKDLIFSDFRKCDKILTGGSTGEPTVFPIGQEEKINNYANTYMARGWWNIKPLDIFLLFWGHSHLFGSGIKGRLNQYKRLVFDWLINTKRLNAYDMSVNTLKKYYDVFFKSNPDVVLGYTSTIYKMARYIKDNDLKIGNKSNLKGVIITSETVTEADIKLVKETFKVPVIIEYGLAETGSVAYSKESTNNLEIFWDSFIAQQDDKNILYLTNIGDKLFPLINYKTDDIVIVEDKINSSILSLKRIKGRTKDIVKIKTIDGKYLELSGILMVHILKNHPNIYGISFKQLENNCTEVSFVSDKNLNIKEVKDYFIREIKKDHENIDPAAIIISQIDKIKKTKAGKEKWIE
jgi:phenylacetate-CoA ligase